jgi:MFS family permease
MWARGCPCRHYKSSAVAIASFAWRCNALFDVLRSGLVVGRLLVGVGIGISAVVVPAYLGEVAPAEARGRIVEVYEV